MKPRKPWAHRSPTTEANAPMQREQSDSVQLKLRIKEVLRQKIEAAARQKGVSLNAEMAGRLERSFEEGDYGQRIERLERAVFAKEGGTDGQP